MGNVLKHIHWILILFTAYEFFNLYTETDEKLLNLESSREALQVQLKRNKKIERDIKQYYANIEEEKVKIEKVASEIEKMQQLLPSEISDTENLSLLRSMAEEINIKEVSIAPEKDEERGFYIARKYRLKIKATFLQMLLLFEKIGENKRILNVGEAGFKKIAQPQRGKFQVISGEFVLESYRFNPNFKESRGIDEIEKKFQEEKNKPKPIPKKASDKEVTE
jgi:Tfp pilus assembly protein PilO